MLDSKFMFTLIGLILAVCAIYRSDFNKKTTENWGGGSFPRRVISSNRAVVNQKNGLSNEYQQALSIANPSERGQLLSDLSLNAIPNSVQAQNNVFNSHFNDITEKYDPVVSPTRQNSKPFPNNYNSSQKMSNSMVSSPSFQASPTPRFANVGFGANIRFNAPDEKNMASPCSPITPVVYADMTNEGYEYQPNFSENFETQENYGGLGACGKTNTSVPDCTKDGLSMNAALRASPPEANYSSKSYHTEMNSLMNSSDFEYTDTLPVGNMMVTNSYGDTEQPIVYDRYIVSLGKSRTQAQGDPIRGDLPIVPCNQGWFSVAANPIRDLKQGAMAVMGGINNESANATSQVIFNTSGGTSTALQGINMTNHLDAVNNEVGGIQSVQYTISP
jgi:hypothetical protein